MENSTSFLSYRENLIRAIERLDKCEELLFDAAFNVMMSGEYAELNALYKAGDIFYSPDGDLDVSEDHNVKIILPAIQKVQEAIQSLQNLNLISDDEVNWGGWED